MQIQNTVFDTPKSKPSNANAPLNSSIKIETRGPVDGVEKAQTILAQNHHVQQDILVQGEGEQQKRAEPQLPTPEQVATRVDAKLQYEQQTQSSADAVAQYLTTQHAEEREAIQQMVGIDLYA